MWQPESPPWRSVWSLRTWYKQTPRCRQLPRPSNRESCIPCRTFHDSYEMHLQIQITVTTESPAGVLCGLTRRCVGTWLPDQWSVRILPGMGGLEIGDVILAVRTGPLKAMKSPSPQCLRVGENLNLMSERSGLVGGAGRRSLWQRTVTEWQCHNPSPTY